MSEYIFRRNAVQKVLESKRRHIHKLWVQKGTAPKELTPYLQLAAQRRIPVEEIDKEKLGNLVQDSGHQGMVIEVADYPYAEVSEMLALAKSRGEMLFLLVLDLVQGPQNVGMLVRSAEAVGVHGIIMQERRAPDITPAMVIASAGATEHLLIAKVTNINTTLDQLKKENIWVIGTAMDDSAQRYDTLDWHRPLALVIGHEGEGMRRQVREHCDLVVSIPQRGHVESLNAAVSGSLLLYHAWQTRGFTGIN